MPVVQQFTHPLTEEAWNEFKDWFYYCDALRREQSDPTMTMIHAKHRDFPLKIALNLHYMHVAMGELEDEAQAIGVDRIRKGIALTQKSLQTAIYVMSEQENPLDIDILAKKAIAKYAGQTILPSKLRDLARKQKVGGRTGETTTLNKDDYIPVLNFIQSTGLGEWEGKQFTFF